MLPFIFNNSIVTIVGIIKNNPPSVGVPYLDKCLSPISLQTLCFIFSFFKTGNSINPVISAKINPSIIAIADFAKINI